MTADLEAGWNYIRLDDPSQFDYRLIGVETSAATLKEENYWQTDRTFVGGGKRPVLEDTVHVLVFAETAGTYSYDLVFEPKDQTAPNLQNSTTPNDITDENVDEIILEFDEPVGLSNANVALLRDNEPATPNPTGGLIPTTSVDSVIPLTGQGIGIEKIDDTHYRIVGLSGLTGEAGDYRLLFDMSNVQDNSGNFCNQTTEFTGWTRVDEAPIVTSIDGVNTLLRNTPVGTVTITFSEEIVSGSFSLDDVVLTRDGGPDLLDGNVSLSEYRWHSNAARRSGATDDGRRRLRLDG